MGHARASTTLNLYTHAPEDYDERVRQVMDGPEDDESPSEEGL
jgi:hypothetical protein